MKACLHIRRDAVDAFIATLPLVNQQTVDVQAVNWAPGLMSVAFEGAQHSVSTKTGVTLYLNGFSGDKVDFTWEQYGLTSISIR